MPKIWLAILSPNTQSRPAGVSSAPLPKPGQSTYNTSHLGYMTSRRRRKWPRPSDGSSTRLLGCGMPSLRARPSGRETQLGALHSLVDGEFGLASWPSGCHDLLSCWGRLAWEKFGMTSSWNGVPGAGVKAQDKQVAPISTRLRGMLIVMLARVSGREAGMPGCLGLAPSSRSSLEWRLDHRGGGPRLASIGRVCRAAPVGDLRLCLAAIRDHREEPWGLNSRVAVCSEAAQ